MSVVASRNTALATQVYNVLKPFLGRYSLNGVDKGKAFIKLETGALSVADGLPAGTKVTDGLEAVFGLYPEGFDGRYEFGDSGVSGVLQYPLMLKSQGAATWPARVALIAAFDLLTTNVARPMTLLPESDIAWERLELFIPVLTD